MFSLFCRRFKQVTFPLNVSRTSAGPSKAYSRTFIRRCVQIFFKKHLVITNTISSGAFMALGDMIHQEYEYQTKVISERYEWIRMKRMATVGGFLGYMHHYYYFYLDILIPKRSIKTTFIKVGLDQFFCAPLTIFCFFYLMGTLEHKNLQQCTDELVHKFKYVYALLSGFYQLPSAFGADPMHLIHLEGDWMFWPPIQCINFYFVPTEYRVFYINAATMVFDVFLSLMKHYDRKV